MTVSAGGSSFTVNAPTPTPVSPFPQLAPHGSAPALDAPADLKFVVPGSALAPVSTEASFTATFSATVKFSVNGGSQQEITFTKQPGTNVDIGAAVDQKTNALRVLAVPMGNASLSYASQFTTDGQAALEAGMLTLSRIFPVPDGTGDLASSTGGVRYTILPTLLDIGPLMGTGKFCGGGSNFDEIKGQLAQFLLSWNTANPDATADRVVGVVDEAISDGTNLGCAEGWSAIGTPGSWVRAATSTSPGTAGALLAMEVGHSMGLVPTNRDHTFDPFHSPNQEADGGTNRGYDIRTHLFISDDRTALRGTGTWNNTTTLLEPIDYAFLLCMLGGSITTDCSAPASVGTSTGVGAGPRFVIAGTTGGMPGTTSVTESYFAGNVALTEPAATSEYFLRQLRDGVVLREDLVAVETVESLHAHDENHTHESGSNTNLFAAVVPFDEQANRIELRKIGVADALYARDRTNAPVVESAVLFSGGEENYSLDPSVDDVWPVVSPDGAWVAWATQPPDDFSRVWVGPIDDRGAAVMLDPDLSIHETQPAWSPDGESLAIISEGDVVIVAVDTSGDEAVFGAETTVYDADSIEPGGAPDAGHPSWSPDGSQIAFDANGAIFVVDAVEGLPEPEQLTFTGDASNPSWSWTPGDDRIAYQRNAPVILLRTATLAAYVEPHGDSPSLQADHGGFHFTVTHDDDLDDGTCDLTHCSLREAINAANDNPNEAPTAPDLIAFDILLDNDADGMLPHVIQPLAPLPVIVDTVVIDGSTEPDYVAGEPEVEFDSVPAVEIDGSLVVDAEPGTRNGLTFFQVGSDQSEVIGLVIASFADSGILMDISSNNSVLSSFIGIDPAGADRGNGVGIRISDGVLNNIGSITPENGNLISGNDVSGVELLGSGSGNQLNSNYIGTDPTGTAAVANGRGVYVTSEFNTIGGTVSGVSVGNLISGNDGPGVLLEGVAPNENFIVSNRIGTNAAGTAALPNAGHGIEIGGGFDNLIGGTLANQGNLISGNALDGVHITGAGATGNDIQGNYIGTDATGMTAIRNGVIGVQLLNAGSNTVGGTAAGARNVISGHDDANGAGVRILGSGSSTVVGNYIGTDASGTAGVQNGVGIWISSPGNTIGGSTAAARNVISGNDVANVFIGGSSASGNVLVGNYIGPDASGVVALGNAGAGIRNRSPNNFIGDDVPGAGNVISGNAGTAIELTGDASSQPTGNLIEGNLIGVAADGTSPLPNTGSGVSMSHGDNDVRNGNVIANNTGAGVFVAGGTGTGVEGNSIYANSLRGIDLAPSGVTPNDTGDGDGGVNDLQNFPVLTFAETDGATTTIQGTLNSLANSTYAIEVFSNGACDPSGNGEGESLLHREPVLTGDNGDGSGDASFAFAAPATTVGDVLTATATNPGGSTSEFSLCLTVEADPDALSWVVNTTDDVVDAQGCTALHCSLREAINRSNVTVGVDTVSFDIPGVAPHVITLGSALPSILDSVVIDGTTEPDYDAAGHPVVELDGSALDADNNHGFYIPVGGTTIRGLAIGGFGGVGIYLDGNGDTTSDGNLIEFNHIGLDAAGSQDRGVAGSGILVLASSDNEIARNVISGNGGNGVAVMSGVAGSGQNHLHDNLIGTTADSSAALGNDVVGVFVDDVVNTSVGPFNVIAANAAAGVEVQGTVEQPNDIFGNWIGTNSAGASGLGNGGPGILVDGGQFTTVGEDTLLGGGLNGNQISGNGGAGILVTNAAATNTIVSNLIGVVPNEGGPIFLPNAGDGIEVNDASDTTIGGDNTDLQTGNLIGGNTGAGIRLEDASGTSIIGNAVGTGVLGESMFANDGAGIEVGPNVSGAEIGGQTSGVANFIAFNGGDGISVDSSSTGIRIEGNSIDQNDGLGIDLGDDGVTANDEDALDDDPGANDLQNFPNLTVEADGSAINGFLRSEALQTYRIELFASPMCDALGHGEGDEFLGSVDVGTNASGFGGFSFAVEPDDILDQDVTGTATDPNGNTSEFSACAADEIAGTQVWTFDPDSPDTTQQLLVGDAGQPFFGDGRVAFTRGGNIWTIEAGGASSSEAQLTDSGTDAMPSLGAGVPAFSRFVTGADDVGGDYDAFLLREQVQVVATVSDGSPENLRLDLFYQCPGSPSYDVAVALPPDVTDASTASWSANYDPSLACPDGTISVIATDGFLRSNSAEAGVIESEPQAPVPTIYGPFDGQQFLQYQGISLHGDAKDAEDGQVTDLEWLLDGASVGTGGSVSLDAPADPGWPLGVHVVTLIATDLNQNSVETSVQIEILGDADNDGLSTEVEAGACFGAAADNDPTNAFDDADGDGYSNLDDLHTDEGPCIAADEYPAFATFGPDVLYIPSQGAEVTITVTVPKRDLRQVTGSTVRITDLSGASMSIPATSWKVDKKGFATASFDRQVVIAKLRELGLVGQTVSITITGSSPSPAWTFTGTDTFQAMPAIGPP